MNNKLHVKNMTEFSAENLNSSVSWDSSINIYFNSNRLKLNFHHLYFILSTKKMNKYMIKDINQWLFCLKILIMQTNFSSFTSINELQKTQLQNEIMISAILHMLRLIISKLESFFISDFWLKSWTFKQCKLHADVALNA